MRNNEHTPGPWVAEVSLRGFEITANHTRIGEAYDHANAKLMAAAPELFAALLDLLSTSGLAASEIPGWAERSKVAKLKARAAINKVTKEEA